MPNFKLVCILLLAAFHAQGQKKFLARIDSAFSSNPLLEQENPTCPGNAELDPYNVDYDLLNCLVVKEINEYRKKRSLKPLVYAPRLDQLAQNYLALFNRNAFVHNGGNLARVNRPLKKAAKKLNYRNGLISAIIYQAELVSLDRKKSDYFHYPESDNAPLNLFYGEKPTEKQVEGGYVFDPVKLSTYEAFAKKFFKEKILRYYSRAINDKAMRQIGCRSQVVVQSLNKRAVPSASFMIITGAPRLELVPRPNH